MFIQRLVIIGVGLIGGSLASILRQRAVCGEIVGCGRSVENLQTAVQLGVIDRYETDPAAAVAGADMVVISVPLGEFANIFRAIRDHVSENVILTDVGSAKACVVNDARAELPSALLSRFVAGHPIAGTEKSGVTAAFPELFENRKVILTPTEETNVQACAQVQAMWEAAGAEVVSMPVEHHDEVLAATSHLPHVLAYSLVDTLARMDERVEVFQFAAGGFRDFTRIASSHPKMWHDICLANRDAVLSVLAQFNQDLAVLAKALEQGDSEQILTIFNRAKAARDSFCG